MNEYAHFTSPCFFLLPPPSIPTLTSAVVPCAKQYSNYSTTPYKVMNISLDLFSQHASFFSLIFKMLSIVSSRKFGNKCILSCVDGICKALRKMERVLVVFATAAPTIIPLRKAGGGGRLCLKILRVTTKHSELCSCSTLLVICFYLV